MKPRQPKTKNVTAHVPAPAVSTAFRILDYLALHSRGAGVSEIASALGIGKSTAFNVLSSLLHHEAVIKDLLTTTWRLGPKLVELGLAFRHGYSARHLIRQALQPIVDREKLSCHIGQVLAAHHGVVTVDRIKPGGTLRPDMAVAAIGTVWPLTMPVPGRVVLAQYDDTEAIAIARAAGFTSSSALTGLMAQLNEIRQRGYGTSIEEYEPGYCAVACVIAGPGGEPAFTLALAGPRREVPPKRMRDLGPQLLTVAHQLETQLAQNRTLV